MPHRCCARRRGGEPAHERAAELALTRPSATIEFRRRVVLGGAWSSAARCPRRCAALEVNIAKGWLLSPSWLLSGGYSRIRQKSAVPSPLPHFPHVAGVVRRCDRRTGQLRRAARRRRGLVVDGGLRGRAREARRHAVVERRRAACPDWGGRPPAQRWSGIALARVTAPRCARSGLGIAAAA